MNGWKGEKKIQTARGKEKKGRKKRKKKVKLKNSECGMRKKNSALKIFYFEREWERNKKRPLSLNLILF